MIKTEFLHILREKLSILEENELEDILNEYEQHIDMKAAGAMTEEAAIADFGDMDELTADILEAYHVRADFVRTKEEKVGGTKTVDRIADSARNACHRAVNLCKGGWKKFLEGLHRIGQYFQGLADQCSKTAGRLFGSGKKQDEKTEKTDSGKQTEQKKNQLLFIRDGKQKEKRDKMERKNRVSLFSILGCMCQGCWNAVVWCGKALWNLFCISIGILTGMSACFCIFLLGTIAVLLVMGYPLVGVTIAVLGMTMCCCSGTALCFTLIIRRKKQGMAMAAAEKEEVKPEEEEGMIHA